MSTLWIALALAWLSGWAFGKAVSFRWKDAAR
jgi:hypothetical protein